MGLGDPGVGVTHVVKARAGAGFHYNLEQRNYDALVI